MVFGVICFIGVLITILRLAWRRQSMNAYPLHRLPHATVATAQPHPNLGQPAPDWLPTYDQAQTANGSDWANGGDWASGGGWTNGGDFSHSTGTNQGAGSIS